MIRASKAARTEPLDGHDPIDDRQGEPMAWADLDAGIQALSPTHREILRLRYFGELSYAELAEALDVPAGTIMSRLHLARKALAAQLHEDAL